MRGIDAQLIEACMEQSIYNYVCSVDYGTQGGKRDVRDLWGIDMKQWGNEIGPLCDITNHLEQMCMHANCITDVVHARRGMGQ